VLVICLGIYGAFTALRLILAYRDRLSFGLKIGSVLVDVSMLMITIWSFHIQYGQPAAFYLKGVSPPHVTLNQIFAGMMPYMGIQVIALTLLYVFPGIGLWLPTVLYK